MLSWFREKVLSGNGQSKEPIVIAHLQRALEASESRRVFAEQRLIEAGISQAEQQLQWEDRGYISFGKDQLELSGLSRDSVVNKARAFWHSNPMAKHAVRLWTDFSVGTGLQFSAENPDVQKNLDAFFNSRRNRRLLSSAGQKKSSHRLLVDGELFLPIFKGEDGQIPTIRRIDPLQITKIHTHPEDDEMPVYYQRDFLQNNEEKTEFYLDWSVDLNEDRIPPMKDEKGNVIKAKEGVVMYHLAFDPFRNRGNSLLLPALNWMRELRRFMEARVGITQALARFAWKGAMKGGLEKLEAQAKKFGTTQTLDTPETNPPKAWGSTWFENEALHLTPFPRTTGGGEARDDSDSLKLMVCAGVGIFLHYFGDPSTGNLATAESMELPMIKQFESYQELWGDAWRDIFSIVLGEEEGETAFVDVDWPPIVRTDISKVAQALGEIFKAVPQIPSQPEVMQMLLMGLGINNVQRIVKRIQGELADGEDEDTEAQNAMEMAAAVARFRQEFAQEFRSRL